MNTKRTDMDGLHAKLTAIFAKTLKLYESRLVVAELANVENIDKEVIDRLMQTVEPNPAMLSAIAKFLKDNDIMYTPDEVEELTAQQQRLSDLKNRRAGNLSLDDLPAVETIQ